MSLLDENTVPAGVSRRSFLSAAALVAGGSLLISADVFLPASRAEAAEGVGGVQTTLYVRIAPDETVTILFALAEMGQGISTALPQILAEELKADWTKVQVQQAGADARLGFQLVGGSRAVRASHDPLRKAGAQAREMLVAAAAARSGLTVDQLVAQSGSVRRRSDGVLLYTFGQLAYDASLLPVPANPAITGSKDLVGQPLQRKDLPAKVNGSAVFGIDVRPDPAVYGALRYAGVQQAPKIGQTLKSFSKPSAGTAFAVPGGVAVVVDTTTWQAIEAARGLRTTWEDAPYTSSLTTSTMKAKAQQLLDSGEGVRPAFSSGDAAAALAGASKRVTATYSAPYLAHATMEPMNATAWVAKDGTSCVVWAPTQSQTSTRSAAAAVTGLPPEAITVHCTYLGGGLGRRIEQDYVKQAVTVAKALPGRPVKLVWSREEDFTHDVYRPSALCRLDAAVDGAGALTALHARVVSPSIVYQRKATDADKAAYDSAKTVDNNAVEGFSRSGAADMPYAIPNLTVEWIRDPAQVPVGYWRSVGHSHNSFFLESLLDEVALATGKDPLQLRRELLVGKSRHLAVLDLLALRSGWGTAPASGRARGVSLTEAFGSLVGQVAEVSGTWSSPVVHRVTVVVDCGSTINPDTVKAQMEGAVIHGLSAALTGEMPFEGGQPKKSNFNGYDLLRMKQAPAVDVHILESGAALGGVGEPGVPGIAPAVAGALAALTGQRFRSMPLVQPASTSTDGGVLDGILPL